MKNLLSSKKFPSNQSLLSRNFCQNTMRVKFRNFQWHCVPIKFPHFNSQWKSTSYKTRSRFLRKNQHFSREINVFTKEVTKKFIPRIFIFAWSHFLSFFLFCTFPHCAAAIRKTLSNVNFTKNNHLNSKMSITCKKLVSRKKKRKNAIAQHSVVWLLRNFTFTGFWKKILDFTKCF